MSSDKPDIGGEVFDCALSDPALAGIVHGYDSGVYAVLSDGTEFTERQVDAELDRITAKWLALNQSEPATPATWRTTLALIGLAVAGCGVWFGGGLLLGWCLWGGAA